MVSNCYESDGRRSLPFDSRARFQRQDSERAACSSFTDLQTHDLPRPPMLVCFSRVLGVLYEAAASDDDDFPRSVRAKLNRCEDDDDKRGRLSESSSPPRCSSFFSAGQKGRGRVDPPVGQNTVRSQTRTVPGRTRGNDDDILHQTSLCSYATRWL